jgi:hypothetical protein
MQLDLEWFQRERNSEKKWKEMQHKTYQVT